MSTLPATMTRAEFARHRGVDRAYITRLAKAGRLVLTDDRKLVRVAESIALLGDTEDPSKEGVRERFQDARAARVGELALGAGTEPNASGSDGEGNSAPARGSMNEARRQLIEEQAARARLLREKEAGSLVDAEAVKRATFEKARVARNALFGMVDVISSRLAAESNPAKVHEMLSGEITRVCEELAAGESEATRQ